MKLRRLLIRSVLGIVVCAALALAAANLVDWYHFRCAVARCHAVTAQEWDRMGARCVVERRHLERFEGAAIPDEFVALRPESVVISHGFTDLEFYQRGDLYLDLRIESDAEMQHAFLFSSLGGGQTSVDLWNSRPDRMAALHPVGRIVSIKTWSRGEAKEWIVLPGEIQVFSRSPYAGVADRLEHSALIREGTRRSVEAAVASLNPEFRGRRYMAEGVADGVAVDIHFSGDGKPDDHSVELWNAWRTEAKPLFDAISAELPEEHHIDYEESMRRMDEHGPASCTIRIWAEVRALDAASMHNIPWWCFWPRFAGPIE